MGLEVGLGKRWACDLELDALSLKIGLMFVVSYYIFSRFGGVLAQLFRNLELST